MSIRKRTTAIWLALVVVLLVAALGALTTEHRVEFCPQTLSFRTRSTSLWIITKHGAPFSNAFCDVLRSIAGPDSEEGQTWDLCEGRALWVRGWHGSARVMLGADAPEVFPGFSVWSARKDEVSTVLWRTVIRLARARRYREVRSLLLNVDGTSSDAKVIALCSAVP